MFRQISFLVIYNMSYIDDLKQNGFSVIPLTTFANLRKPIQNIIIIPISSDPLNLKTVEREKLQKIEYAENEKRFLDVTQYKPFS